MPAHQIFRSVHDGEKAMVSHILMLMLSYVKFGAVRLTFIRWISKSVPRGEFPCIRLYNFTTRQPENCPFSPKGFVQFINEERVLRQSVSGFAALLVMCRNYVRCMQI